MQKRKSFFNNETEQRFSLRKYTIGLCSVCLGFVAIGMGSQTVKADTVNNVEKSSAVQENKAQDVDSANTDALAESKTNTSDSVVAKSNTTPTETKENEAGSVAATAPKTADSNNSASVNTLDQSKLENSSAVAPTSEKTQLQTSQDSSIKAKENSLNNKSNAMKAVFKFTNLNKENNSSDPNSKDAEVKPKESSNLDTNEQKEKDVDVAKPTRETVGSQWRIHYIDSTNHEHELKAPTVINMQYVRTNTPQSDGTIQHGDWSYVSGSFKLTGTPITVNDSDNPVKDDNVDNNGKNEDVFTITAMYPTITGYNFHDGINNSRLHDHLLNYDPNGNIQRPTMGQDFYVEYDPISERSVAVKFVDDQSYDFNTSDHKKQVGQAITLTGHDGDTVNLNLTVPDKYQLADGQQLPTTYTFTAGSGDVTIHLAHKVVQREATIDVQLSLITSVHTRANDYAVGTVTQARWKQLGDEINDSVPNPVTLFEVLPSVKAGTLTGHVDYDLVDEKVVSLGDDWTTLNLGGKTYQLPNGDEVVNGIMIDSDTTWGKSFKEENLKFAQIEHVDLDPDYVNRPWHGYLSVNATNNDDNGLIDETRSMGLQAGLVGDEPNALAKAIGDRAATSVEMANKTIDPNWLKGNSILDFSEQDGQLRAKAPLLVAGVYIPYVEKTATRTINVTTPDGKTTTVKQTATLAKQVDFGKNTHPTWTTGEWANYDVPTISGYTARQSNVAKETVTSETKDQTVNITYTANDGTQTIVYQDEDGSEIGKQVISGKTDEKVKVTSDVPDGYVLKGEIPTEVTIKPDDTPITVTVEHGKNHVTPDKPVNKGDLIPGTKGKYYPEGLTHNNLNKTVTREVTITDPTGKKSTTTQTVTFTRGATVDEVTNKVTYDDWSENGKHTFDKVDVPNVSGYTASGEVPSIVATPETQSLKVDVTYTANAQTAKITYIDDTEKKTLGSDQQNGKFNQVIIFEHDPAEVIKGLEEKGYKLVSDNFKQGVKYQNDNKSNSFEVHLVHTYEPVETSQTITETVHYIDANGKPVAPDHVAKAVIEMTGTRDKVTNSITWNTPSTGHFDEVISSEVPNMTPDKKFIPSRNVQYGDSDITENIVYTSDETSREPEKPNDQGKSNSKTSEKTNKSGNPTSKTSEKSNDQGKPNTKTSEKPNNSDNSTSRTPKKPNKSGKDVSKQFGTLTKATISEKSINSRTSDNGVSTKSTAKRELPQTGATTNIGIWTGLVSMIAGLGLFGASKKRKKN